MKFTEVWFGPDIAAGLSTSQCELWVAGKMTCCCSFPPRLLFVPVDHILGPAGFSSGLLESGLCILRFISDLVSLLWKWIHSFWAGFPLFWSHENPYPWIWDLICKPPNHRYRKNNLKCLKLDLYLMETVNGSPVVEHRIVFTVQQQISLVDALVQHQTKFNVRDVL